MTPACHVQFHLYHSLRFSECYVKHMDIYVPQLSSYKFSFAILLLKFLLNGKSIELLKPHTWHIRPKLLHSICPKCKQYYCLDTQSIQIPVYLQRKVFFFFLLFILRMENYFNREFTCLDLVVISVFLFFFILS